MIEKTDVPNLVRDTATRALINTDNGGFTTYKENRDREMKVNAICNQVNNLHCEISEIKSLLTNLLSKVNNG
jgi:hypothetical protein